MPDPAIRLEGVSKQYRLGASTGGLLSEALERTLRAPLKLVRSGRAADGPTDRIETFWALRDVSLEVDRGEAVGLVGANGAGKSTLLKLLSRISPPTEGRITLRGRVATLLEVGTGFHPELTGRENIYLNGTILGMRRREIAARFDEIVEFAGVEQFIDTPVKRYSSGMYVRLAFAVAAHLQTEILLVDEVLAVGDTAFQKKCLGKMREVGREGRTIIFVSHNLSAVQRLCDRSFWIDRGRVAAEGRSNDVIARYLSASGAAQGGGRATIEREVPRIGTGAARLVQVRMVDGDGEPLDRLSLGEVFSFLLTFDVVEPIEEGVVELGLSTEDGTRVVTVQNVDGARPPLRLDTGTHEVQVRMDLTLLPGDFTVDVGLHHLAGLTYDYVERTLTFAALNYAKDTTDRYPWNIVRGSVRPSSEWSVRSEVPAPKLTVPPV